MSEEMVVQQDAPTLAGIKTGSLFPCPCAEKDALLGEIRAFNRRYISRGLCLLPLRFTEGKALLYLYRPAALQRDLRAQAAEALHIHKNSLQYRLNRLARRLNICACAHRSWGWGRFGFSTPAIRRRISAAMSEAVSWSFAARCAWAMLPKRPRQDPEWSFPS